MFVLKPIFWNNNGYVAPAGGVATSGYPKLYGFGHEEWNNSPRMEFVERGVSYKVFHTEEVGKLELTSGNNFIFMYASHSGKQWLVGIAGNATSLAEDLRKREQLADRLRVDEFWKDVWKIPSIQSRFKTLKDFKLLWKKDVSWIPNWICPSDMFIWLERPVSINPMRISGKRRLINMYSRYQEASENAARYLIALVPEAERSRNWYNILTEIDKICEVGEIDDVNYILSRDDLLPTDREALVRARLGQGRYRAELDDLWGHSCAVTGCAQREMLRASHIKPWRVSTDRERLDKNNGILLTAHLDALFDRGLISFCANGEMMVSQLMLPEERSRWNLPSSLAKKVNKKQASYLNYHQRYIYKK